MKSPTVSRQLPKHRAFVLTSFILLLLALSLSFWSRNSHLSKPTDLSAVFANKNYLAFEDYAQKNSAAKAYLELKKYFPNNDPAAHDFAHVVGIAAYEKQGLSGLAVCDFNYNYGCHHGLIESFIGKNGFEKIGEIEAACVKLGNIHAPSCLHGIGHGVMVNRSYDLKTALGDCDRLASTSQIYCWDGVFMERNIASMVAKKQNLINPQDLNDPCDRVEVQFQGQCYRNQVFLWYSYFGGDSTKIGDQCASLKKDFWDSCYESIGLQNITVNRADDKKLVNFCQLITPPEGVDGCLMGSLKELMFEGQSPDFARTLCYYVTPPRQAECSSTFGSLFAEYQQRFKI